MSHTATREPADSASKSGDVGSGRRLALLDLHPSIRSSPRALPGRRPAWAHRNRQNSPAPETAFGPDVRPRQRRQCGRLALVESHKSRLRLPGTRYREIPPDPRSPGRAITAFEELLPTGSSAPPDRPERVDDMGGWQTMPGGEPRLPW